MASLITYRCKTGCCLVVFDRDTRRGGEWRLKLNGAATSNELVAKACGIATSSARKRVLRRECLQRGPQPRGLKHGKRAVEPSPGMSLGTRFAIMKRPPILLDGG